MAKRAKRNKDTQPTTDDIGFEQQICAAADILRGNMDAAEYKHVVLGLIFLNIPRTSSGGIGFEI